ncbi:hypothetical protein DIPPA_20805 [Diplonema papillatum]|nr:hypothetical protein DIPPA_20805 [Diplonema papillatum]
MVRTEHVGKSTYYSEDGKLWVLQGKTEADADYCWRVKVDQQKQAFYVNQGNARKKVWELPDIVEADLQNRLLSNESPEGLLHGALPKRYEGNRPVVLLVRSRNKREAEGVFTLSADGRNGMPLWTTRKGSALYSTAEGNWVIGTVTSMQTDTGWVMSAEPHHGFMPQQVLQWTAYSGTQWVLDPAISVTTVEPEPTRAVESPEPLQRTHAGSSTYVKIGGNWVLEGMDPVRDQAHVWKERVERNGVKVYVNPWTRVKATVLPDVKEPRSSPPSPGTAAAGGADFFESELDQYRRTIQALEHKEQQYQKRGALLQGSIEDVCGDEWTDASDDAAVQRKLDALESKLLQERERLQRQAAKATGSINAELRDGNLDSRDEGVSALERMHDILRQQERDLHSRAQHLEQHAELQSLAAQLSRAKYQQETGALEPQQQQQVEAYRQHQDYLTMRALALEQEHEMETLKLQETARQLEKLQADKRRELADKGIVNDGTVADLHSAVDLRARELEARERRIASIEDDIRRTPSRVAAETELRVEQEKLQADVNDFYLQTSQALTTARRDVESKVINESKRRGNVPPPSAVGLDQTPREDDRAASPPAGGRRVASGSGASPPACAFETPPRRRESQPRPAAGSDAPQPLSPASARLSSKGRDAAADAAAAAQIGEELRRFARVKEDALTMLQQQQRDLQLDYERREAQRETRVNEIQQALQQDVVQQLHALKAELYGALKTDRSLTPALSLPRDGSQRSRDEGAAVSGAEGRLRDAERRLGEKDAELDAVERALADLRVEHEKEKAAMLRAAQDDAARLTAKLDELRAGASPPGEKLAHHRAEAERAERKNEELRKEVVRLRLELSEIQDAHNSELKQADDSNRRDVARLRAQLHEVKETVRVEHRRDIEALTERCRLEKETLTQEHAREVEALSDALSSEKRAKEAHAASSADELAAARERHATEVALLREQYEQEKADLKIELRDARRQVEILQKAAESAQLRGQRAAAAAAAAGARADSFQPPPSEASNRSRSVGNTPLPGTPAHDTASAYSDFTQRPDGLAAAQAATRSRSSSQQLNVILNDELKKLQESDVPGPGLTTHTRLKRFRDRSSGHRSVSAEVPQYVPSAASQGLPTYQRQHSTSGAGAGLARASPSPAAYSASPSPYHRSASPSVSRLDEIKRLQQLKEQMRQRLTAEQTTAG